jgi:hypothetical protein
LTVGLTGHSRVCGLVRLVSLPPSIRRLLKMIFALQNLNSYAISPIY